MRPAPREGGAEVGYVDKDWPIERNRFRHPPQLDPWHPIGEIAAELVANVGQIKAWSLPTRPTKKTDTRGKTFKGASVEADAIPPADLRAIVEEAITQHIDKAVLNTTMVAERSEREIVRAWAKQLEAGAT